MANLALGSSQHSCLLYSDAEEQRRLILPYIRDGLKAGEHCVLTTGAASIDAWYQQMERHGIDHVAERQRGALSVFTDEQLRSRPEFNSITEARALWQFIAGKQSRFPGIRIAGDASWFLVEPALDSGQICHWEATVNLLVERTNVRIVCMYERGRHPAANVRAALRTHPGVVLEGNDYVNANFEAWRILENEPHLNASDADDAFVDGMLAQIKESRWA